MVTFIETWIIVGTLAFSLAVPLGPVNLEVMKQALNKTVREKIAWSAALITGVGAMSGDFIVAFSALTIGGEVVSVFFSTPLVRFVLFSINILILGYLGISTLFRKNLDKETLEYSDESKKKSKQSVSQILIKQYTTGFSLVVTSPWTYLWWVSAGTLILLSDFNTPDLLSRLAIVLMFVSGVFTWIILFTTTLSIIGQLPNPTLFHWVTKGSALILLFFALLMLEQAWGALLEMIYVSLN